MTLASSRVRGRSGAPTGWTLFLHGILGSRSNWRSVARRFVDQRPGRGAVLVDLREHGDSRGQAPPHDLEAAARDLDPVADSLDGPVRAVLGHSFGGKVALAWAARRGEPLEALWVVDSNPGARPDARGSEGTVGVLSMLEALPRRWPRREAFVARVVTEGWDEGLARWLAMNLARTEDGRHELAIDLDAIGAMLDDYFTRDLWHVLERPPPGLSVHLVIAARSTVLDEADRERARRAAARSSQVQVHVIDSGHWVHVDAPDALLSLLAAAP